MSSTSRKWPGTRTPPSEYHRRRYRRVLLQAIATMLVFSMSLVASFLKVAFISIPAIPSDPVGFVGGAIGMRRNLRSDGNITSSTYSTPGVMTYRELEERILIEAEQSVHKFETAYNMATVVQSPHPPWFVPKKICQEGCCAESVAISLDQDERKIINTLDGLDLADILIRMFRNPGHARFHGQSLHERVLPCVQPGTIFHLDNHKKILSYFFKKVRPKITVPFVLMTTESDADSPFLYREEVTDDDLLTKWYGTNPNILEVPNPKPKFVPFPLGLSKHHDQNNFLSPYLALTNYANPFLDKSKWTSRVQDLSIDDVFIKFGVNQRSKQRQVILDHICMNQRTKDGISCSTNQSSPSKIYAAASSYLFGVSPPGAGYDCYRTYELLLLGVIPIISYRPSSKRLFEGLPVVQIRNMYDNSTNATQNYVRAAQDYINSDEFRDAEFVGWERLFLKYWRRRILKDAGRDNDILTDAEGREYYQAWRYSPINDKEILCSDERHCTTDGSIDTPNLPEAGTYLGPKNTDVPGAGTFLGPKNLDGSKHATVMAMASGYDLGVYHSFVGSLRKSGFQGNIILGVSAPLKPDVEEYFREARVTAKFLKFVNCTFDPEGDKQSATTSHQKEMVTCAHPYSDIKLRWSRFPLLRDWLDECKECTGPVLVCDARDTLFQRDPFGVGAPAVMGLQVFQEHASQTTKHWITQAPIKKCKGLDFSKPPYLNPMLCSGTTIGTREAMLKYLGIMHEEMKVWMQDPNCCCNEMNGDDQSIHNLLFYTGKLPFAIPVPHRMGIVNTAGVQGSLALNGHAATWEKEGLTRSQAMKKPYQGAEGKHRWIGREFDLINDEGYFTDFDHEPSRVVHQYDRFGLPFKRYLLKKHGKLWESFSGPDGVW